MSTVKLLIAINTAVIGALIINSGCHSNVTGQRPLQLNDVLRWQTESGGRPSNRDIPKPTGRDKILSRELLQYLIKRGECLVIYFGNANYQGEAGCDVRVRPANCSLARFVRSDLEGGIDWAVISLGYIGQEGIVKFCSKQDASLQVNDLGESAELQVLAGDIIVLSAAGIP